MGGTDVQKHIIAQVRDSTISNNMLLMKLGSGPVVRVSNN